MKNKLLISHLFFVIISGAILYFKIEEKYLIWNMFLALSALDFSFCLNRFKNLFLSLLFGLLWFFFYPNTFYMLTDVVHMNFVTSIFSDPRSLILYFLFLASILFGVLCGAESVSQFFKRFNIRDFYAKLVLMLLLSFVSSMAIHLGRYARLNSWDIALRPLLVIDELTKVFSQSALPFILGFTFLQVMVLLFFNQENTK
ncbi:DUF1361 domain-containing protein [Streptococcus caviae]|uniref:DUF1361 domain-containing protein n=1 Tax=Streptococcus sp. 'caviae' TaxID=1915004 RepID=UPI00094BC67D|nr:DUF1361 domain-containing protein [Streptococcus sp. 'caviae']OLN84590.1 hypothetical protein BMI76_00490 [Streptococcus sp. 'caviae']